MEILKKADKLEHDILLCFKHNIASTLKMFALRGVAGAVLGGGLGAWLLMRVRPKACKKKCFSGGASLEDYTETALMIQYTTLMIFAFFLY